MLGIDAKASTPAEIDARMRSDIDKWAKVIEAAHIPEAIKARPRKKHPPARDSGTGGLQDGTRQ